MRPSIRYCALAALSLASACTIPADTSTVIKEDKTVATARSAMVGLSEADIRMCAGFPTMGTMVGATEKIWTYQRIYPRGTLSVGASTLAVGPTPGLTGTTGLGTSGCRRPCHRDRIRRRQQHADIGQRPLRQHGRSLRRLCQASPQGAAGNGRIEAGQDGCKIIRRRNPIRGTMKRLRVRVE
jgi:hypothetical protein